MEATYKKFGPVRLVQGVTLRNMYIYYFATATAMLLFSFLPLFQPFLLAEVLHIPESQQGALSGNLSLFDGLVVLATIGGWGALSDKIGRRFVFSAGFLIMAGTLLLYPNVASIPVLFLYRGLFAVGSSAATTMISTVIADFAVNEDRGKASGLQAIGNGIGAMLTVFVVLQLPKYFLAQGASALDAGELTYWIIAGVGVITAVLLGIGLQNRTRSQREQQKSVLQIMREGFAAAKDPGVALAYLAAFISRGDLSIVGTFFSLWIVTHGTAQGGLSTADALARAGMIIGISHGVALISAPIFGMLVDRMSRANATILTVGLASIGYGSTLLVRDPTDPIIYLVAALIGLGEIGGVIASGVLVAQQAPSEIRGSVVGVFSWCGTIGIMVATGIGGQLFDRWLPQGPFVLFSAFGVIVVLVGLAVRHRIVPRNEKGEYVATD